MNIVIVIVACGQRRSLHYLSLEDVSLAWCKTETMFARQKYIPEQKKPSLGYTVTHLNLETRFHGYSSHCVNMMNTFTVQRCLRSSELPSHHHCDEVIVSTFCHEPLCIFLKWFSITRYCFHLTPYYYYCFKGAVPDFVKVSNSTPNPLKCPLCKLEGRFGGDKSGVWG